MKCNRQQSACKVCSNGRRHRVPSALRFFIVFKPPSVQLFLPHAVKCIATRTIKKKRIERKKCETIKREQCNAYAACAAQVSLKWRLLQGLRFSALFKCNRRNNWGVNGHTEREWERDRVCVPPTGVSLKCANGAHQRAAESCRCRRDPESCLQCN